MNLVVRRIFPTPASLSPVPGASADYRRQARRIRHQHRGRPAQMHLSLRKLSSDFDASQPTRISTPHVPGADISAATSSSRAPHLPRPLQTKSADAFAAHVAAALEGGTLRYSQRQGLLQKAAALAIEPFEANLIIAIVQNRSSQTIQDRPPSPRRIPTLAIFVMIEALLLIGVLALLKW